MAELRNLLDEPRALCRVDGARVPSNLSINEFAGIAPRALRPVSSIPAWKGKQSYEGRWWFSTLECHVPYASARERDVLIWLDFSGCVVELARDPAVVVPARTQLVPPLRPWLYTQNADGSRLLYVGDLDPEVAAGLAVTLVECGLAVSTGSVPTAEVMRVVRWLAGYRFTRFRLSDDVESELRRACASPTPIIDVIGSLADRLPYGADRLRANLYSQLWRHRIQLLDERRHLSDATMVCAA